MYHMSANLAFGRREKNIWGYKKLQGGKKPIRKTEKKWRPFFFFFFLETVKNLWGRQKMSRGAPNGNVTPLATPTKYGPRNVFNTIKSYYINNNIMKQSNHIDIMLIIISKFVFVYDEKTKTKP